MMIRAAFLLLTLIGAPLRAQEYPAMFAVAGVAADDVLNIRERPDAGAPIIGTLGPDATEVEVLSIADGWAVVNAPELTGYVAARFLDREDGPEWNALETPLTCLGTEPFWSLSIDPEARTTSWRVPESETPDDAAIGQIWPGTPWARAAALSLSDGLAVLQPAECSDGMSDRTYGISVDIFLQGGDQTRYSGCCLLGLR
jgi:uncharacterized membrane protein